MRILIGMSGGLDSTIAAHLLKKQGHETEGLCILMHPGATAEAARAEAEKIGMPFHTADCREQFDREVVSVFADEYAHARTPNPCVDCNAAVKFAALCDFAEKNGFDAAATGHYCRIVKDEESGRYGIGRAADGRKDQSYMLWRLSQKQLSMLIFPLAEEEKTAVRGLARDEGFPEVADAEESQEICFIPDNDHASFIERRLGRSFPEGDFIDRDGRTVGRHRGIIRYTIGQRKRLGIALGQPVYVSKIDAETNTVTVEPEHEPEITFAEADGLNFQLLDPAFAFSPSSWGEKLHCFVKLRYAAPPVGAVVAFLRGENGREYVRMEFDAPVKAVTPGQSAVFYDRPDGEGRVLFGGKLK